MGFFSIEGKFFRTLTKAGDFLILALLGLVFSLPVVTIGASLTAVYYVALKEVRDEEGYVWRGFWKSWRQNMKQSIVIELIIVVLGALLCFDFKICYNWSASEGSQVGNLLMFASVGLMLILVAVSMYIFPVLAKFDNTIAGTFKNSLVLAMHHFPQTLAMIVINGALIIFSIQFFTAFIVTIPIIYYVNAYILARVFQPYITPDEEKKDEDSSASNDEKLVNNDQEVVEDVQSEEVQLEDTQLEDVQSEDVQSENVQSENAGSEKI